MTWLRVLAVVTCRSIGALSPFGIATPNDSKSAIPKRDPIMRTQPIAVGVASLIALLGGHATPSSGTVPAIPDHLKVPATQTLSLEAHAVGVQIYDCKPRKDDPARFEWVFRAPEADLFDPAGKKIGKHYAGPTWEANDGSKVVGEVKARDDGPDSNAIPWLLLDAKSTSGAGVLGQTVSVQRVQTVGGTAPAGGCTHAQAGEAAQVPYSATYYFYVATPYVSAYRP